jgi:radical SAM superfamily enzyme YgiQ (UPF0313 family)
MRVLLVHPPLNAEREVTPPLGLCTLASWLRHKQHDVRIVDLDLESKGHPEREAWSLRLLERAVRDFAPEAVGITSMYNNSLQGARLAETVKRVDSSIATIGGGSHFGALGQETLRRLPEMDFVIEGEGEIAFSDLLAALKSGLPVAKIPRLHYRRDGELCRNAPAGLMDLATLPPMWSTLDGVLDLRRYARTVPEETPRRSIYIEAGRGCPFTCTFCATAPFWERKYRVKTPAQIIEEMRFLHEQHGYRGFMLVHDLLTANKQFINAFSDAMMDSRLPVEWMANHRTDIDLHGLLPKMKTAGCWAMFFGIESASARLQKEFRKGLERDDVVATISGLSDLGIASTCSFVIGFPSETREELSSSIGMGAELKLIGAGLVQFHRLRTWPPAPLSRAKLPAEFDLDSLRIEYPFADIAAEDVAVIKDDPEFFAGYFAPFSAAGTFQQLAQMELFFTQAVAIAPLTVAVAGRFIGAGLVDSFCSIFSARGGITRKELEAEASDPLSIWRILRPYLVDMFAACPALEDWQRDLALSVLRYEEQRLKFIHGDGVLLDGIVTSGDNWAAFVVNADITAVFEAFHAGMPITADLARPSAVVLVRHGLDSYRGYTADVTRIGDLSSHPVLAQAARQPMSSGQPVSFAG